ncbi:putative protein MJ0120 [Propionispora sp. 2/2-37]|uniref:GTP-binding protein n=1 Tax=Propionispora sp. 2/2-37 TaxID=1677858 RepID=UPI0006BB82CF|nr:GTP-binding protein [Propionispora sp. 2/2-37]CUH94870.1 putative protein MJ0120 [Propionispora sp. 2/2-37]
MKVITVAGPPASGKTAVIIKVAGTLMTTGKRVGVVKFDCLSTQDRDLYERKAIPVKVGLSGNLCPDHFFVSNIEDCLAWGRENKFDFLISESAGLCNRCAPHIRGVKAVCIIDNLSGVHAPKKVGPMLKLADMIIITKGDIVSQAEREVFTFRVKQVNPGAIILHVNGLTGQGAYEAGTLWEKAGDLEELSGRMLRFSLPAATCSYCLGQTRIGENYQMGNVRKMNM